MNKRNSVQVKDHKLATTAGYKFLLDYGGSGGGKSYFWPDVILELANRAPSSRHAIFRLTPNTCEKTLFAKTLHEVLDKSWPGLKDQPGFEISLSTMTATTACEASMQRREMMTALADLGLKGMAGAFRRGGHHRPRLPAHQRDLSGRHLFTPNQAGRPGLLDSCDLAAQDAKRISPREGQRSLCAGEPISGLSGGSLPACASVGR